MNKLVVGIEMCEAMIVYYSLHSEIIAGFSFVLSQNISNFDQVFEKKILTSTRSNECTTKTYLMKNLMKLIRYYRS